jgi:hypothetical protein
MSGLPHIYPYTSIAVKYPTHKMTPEVFGNALQDVIRLQSKRDEEGIQNLIRNDKPDTRGIKPTWEDSQGMGGMQGFPKHLNPCLVSLRDDQLQHPFVPVIVEAPIGSQHAKPVGFVGGRDLCEVGCTNIVGGRSSHGLSSFTLPPTLEGSKEGLYAGISGVSMEFGRRVPTHEMLRLQPEAFVPDGTPKGGDGLTVQLPALSRQLIELWCFADLHSVYMISAHGSLFFFSAPKTGIAELREEGLKPVHA